MIGLERFANMARGFLSFGRTNEDLERIIIAGAQAQSPLHNLLSADRRQDPLPPVKAQVQIFEEAGTGQVAATKAKAVIRERLTNEGRFSRWYGGAKEANRRWGKNMSQARGARN